MNLPERLEKYGVPEIQGPPGSEDLVFTLRYYMALCAEMTDAYLELAKKLVQGPSNGEATPARHAQG